jgi:ssDNA-binding Zn-finger/Zn-ribbon topoisomerase 1
MALEHEQAGRTPTIYKCPHCRTEYELIMAHLSFRQRSYANCQACHKTMYSWNGSSVPRFTLVKRSDGEFSNV